MFIVKSSSFVNVEVDNFKLGRMHIGGTTMSLVMKSLISVLPPTLKSSHSLFGILLRILKASQGFISKIKSPFVLSLSVIFSFLLTLSSKILCFLSYSDKLQGRMPNFDFSRNFWDFLDHRIEKTTMRTHPSFRNLFI